MTQKSSREIRIGELLKALGLVKETQITETLKLAMQVGMPLGRSLVIAGLLSEEELDIALKLQTLMRSGSLDFADATRAFTYVTEEHLPLAEALARIEKQDTAETRSARQLLGSMLVDAQFIGQRDLEEAQRTSRESGFTLNRALGLLGSVPPAVLARALELQSMITEEKIGYSEAVKVFGTKQSRRLRDQARRRRSDNKVKVPLTHLLIFSGVLPEVDLLNAVEEALTSSQPLGKVLTRSGAISQEVFDLALELQLSIADGSLDVQAAADALKYVATTTTGGVEESWAEQLRLGEILKKSGLIDADDIEQAMELSTRYTTLVGKMFVVTGAISEATLMAALRAQTYLRRGAIELSDAIKALQLCDRESLGFEEALESLSITVSARTIPNASLKTRS